MKILCVAEKPSIAKAVSQILSGGRLDVSGTGNNFIKNYKFSSRFPEWGECDVVFTSVAGHLTEVDFDNQWRKWTQCAPVSLFEEARIVETIPPVYRIKRISLTAGFKTYS
jgi:DNA topoisomerase III